MKKILLLLLSLLLSVAFVACQKEEAAVEVENVETETETETETEAEFVTIRVGATPVPHVELLELVKDDLKAQGIVLEIIEFTNYMTPNIALNDGDLDANFFQHVPYLNEFSTEHNLDLTSIGTVHVEPLGLYSNTLESIENLVDGASIAIPSDSVNGGRALILLEEYGLITLKADAGLKATENDIAENPHNLKFTAVEAAQLPKILVDVDLAVINGNYALGAGLSPAEDALLLEGSESPYANIVVVKTKDQENEALNALVDALQTEKVSEFIKIQYGGGVVEAFGK